MLATALAICPKSEIVMGIEALNVMEAVNYRKTDSGMMTTSSNQCLRAEYRSPASSIFQARGFISRELSRMLKPSLALAIGLLLIVVPARAGDVLCKRGTGATTSGTFSATGTMTSARSLHTATLLLNGKVLLAGGAGAGGESATFLSTAEIYDPARRKFVATGSMSAPRLGAAAVRLRDGQVLVVGGENTSNIAVNTAEIYNPSTGRWTLISPMNYARINPTATLLNDGMVLIVGGYSVNSDCCALDSAELFDPKTNSFSTTGFMSVARRNHTATLLKKGLVLITGGYNGQAGVTVGSGNVNAPELYDPVTGVFDSTGDMSSARRYPTATLMQNGKVLVAGGYDDNSMATSSAEAYEPKMGSFELTGPMLLPRGRHTATLLTNGMVMVAGGYDSSGKAMASAELYDPATRVFSATGSMTIPRWRHTETRLLDGDVLIAGGSDGSSAVASAELYSIQRIRHSARVCR